jgi:plasmid replication initiation protein
MATLSRKAKPKKKSNLVKIKNDLVESFVRQNNLTALKIIFYLAYDTNTSTDYLARIRINTKELCEYCNINLGTLKKNIKKMTETSISWKDEKAEHFVCVIPRARFDYGGYLEIEMYQDILDMIIGVKNKYTTINAEQLMRMKSKHSARMLLLLEMINGFDEHIPKLKRYELEELNLLFGTNYKRLGQFEQEVLKKAKEDLYNNSKLSFVYDINYDKEAHTIGRAKAVAVTIHLIDNQPKPTLF